MRIPTGNHLETLKGDRSGQYSIRINDQWRICFYWSNAGADDNGYWLRAQAAHDTEVAERNLLKVISKIKPWAENVAQQSN